VARAVVQLVQPDRKLNLDGGQEVFAPEAPPDCTREVPREREFVRGILAEDIYYKDRFNSRKCS